MGWDRGTSNINNLKTYNVHVTGYFCINFGLIFRVSAGAHPFI